MFKHTSNILLRAAVFFINDVKSLSIDLNLAYSFGNYYDISEEPKNIPSK